MDVPQFVQDEFGKFYQATFDRQVERDEMRTVFTEYVWNMGWCDPCAAPPLNREELRQLGVFWLDSNSQDGPQPGMSGVPGVPGVPKVAGAPMMNQPIFPPPPGPPVQVILTRLHIRYSAATLPEDLTFQQTQDQENFQARYVIRHPWTGSPDACAAASDYFAGLRHRHETDAVTLAGLTGWNLADVLKQAGLSPEDRPEPWWRQLWDAGRN
jgi:hypothetical protein